MTRNPAILMAAAIAVAACSGTPAAPSTAASSPTGAPTASVAASAPHTVTPTPAPTTFSVLPGEPWLTYVWYPDVIYLVRPDGSDVRALDIGPGDIPFSPAWSPDGEQLIFVRRNATGSAFWTANADGSGARRLYDGNGECGDGVFWPSWSPDGSKIAFVCYYTTPLAGMTEISVLDPRTMERTGLVTYPYPMTSDNPISWSPDGSTLAYEIIMWDPTDTFLAESVIATIPVTGGHPTTLSDATPFAAHPDWSPDGSLITFNTYDTGNMHGIDEPSNIYVIGPDGKNLRQVSTASVDGKMRLGQPFWSADGTRIWVSVAYDDERDSHGQPKNVLGWVDLATGVFHEIGTEGKRFRERPAPLR